VKYSGEDRSKIIRDEHLKSTLKAIFNNTPPKTVITNLSKSDLYKGEMLKFVQKEISNEVLQILRKESELFQGHSSDTENLLFYEWKQKGELLKREAPYFYAILSDVICLDEGTDLPRMLTAAAVLLYGRSQRQSQLQYILGLAMKKCGLTKEV